MAESTSIDHHDVRGSSCSSGGRRRHRARTGTELYAALPLAQFDRRARRFWRRVFLLVRIPGGRSLLGMLTYVSRKRS